MYKSFYPSLEKHVHIHTHNHIHIHLQVLTNTHTYINANKPHLHIYAHTHMQMHAQISLHVFISEHTFTHSISYYLYNVYTTKGNYSMRSQNHMYHILSHVFSTHLECFMHQKKKLEKNQKAWDQIQMLLSLIFPSTVRHSILTSEWTTASSVFITLVF